MEMKMELWWYHVVKKRDSDGRNIMDILGEISWANVISYMADR